MSSSDTNNRVDVIFNPEQYTTIDELRTLSLSAINSIISQAFCDSIETGISKRKIQESLVSIWSITDNETAKYIIEWLLYDGQDVLFETIKGFVEGNDFQNLNSKLTRLAVNSEFIKKYEKYIGNIVVFQDKFPERKLTLRDIENGIKAWDISRAVFVARMCLDMKYISTTKFDKYINSATEVAKSRYGSWNEYSRGYAIGRAMFSLDGTLPETLEVINYLLEAPQSVWQRTGWFR